jgi:hypothetical protein
MPAGSPFLIVFRILEALTLELMRGGGISGRIKQFSRPIFRTRPIGN